MKTMADIADESRRIITADNPWISVKERLPEDGGSVLVYSPVGGVAEGVYSKNYKKWVQYRWSVFEPKVTHWMPMPEPPKEGV